LSHELGHVYIGPSTITDLHEAIAVAVSLHVLDQLTKRWHSQLPPYSTPVWRDYASEFQRYRQSTLDNYLELLPRQLRDDVEDPRILRLYLRYKRGEQNGHPLDRALNHFDAIALLSDDVPWKDLVGIGTPSNPTVRLGDLLCRRLGRECQTGFIVAQFDRQPLSIKEGLLFGYDGKWIWLFEFDRQFRDERISDVLRRGGQVVRTE
jgi:hypothetical protein